MKVTDLSSGEVVTVAASSMKAPELFRMKEHSARAITTTYKTLEKGGIDPVCGYVFTPLISLKTKVQLRVRSTSCSKALTPVRG